MKNRERVLFADAERAGTTRVSCGVFLSSQASILADQAGWADDDEAKKINFTTAPYWITTASIQVIRDSGSDPIGISTEEELADFLKKFEL
jgi:hypothetical protein